MALNSPGSFRERNGLIVGHAARVTERECGHASRVTRKTPSCENEKHD